MVGVLLQSSFVLLGVLTSVVLPQTQGQPGFISIDCGLPENSSYTDKSTGINYISDAGFIDTGVSKSVSPEENSTHQQQFSYLRSFPNGMRNCYKINVTSGNIYLIRASFLYGNYDGLNKLPQFDLHLGVNFWETVKFKNSSLSTNSEVVYSPSLNYINLCLVNTGNGIPFISAIELRIWSNTLKTVSTRLLTRILQLDLGSITNKTYRYKDDFYDRLWEPYSNKEWTQLSSTSLFKTELKQSSNGEPSPPAVVMSTAATPKNATASLDFYWDADKSTDQYSLCLYFAEVQKLAKNETRAFNISLNGNYLSGPVVPNYGTTTSQCHTTSSEASGYGVSIFRTEFSTLPPIVNALQIFKIINFSEVETEKDDVDAITNIKIAYRVTKNWQGDPCAPLAYKWEGLDCNITGGAPRITSLNLSSSGLTGHITSYISKLTMLEYLDLSNNSLSGDVPYFLAELQSLKVLNLKNNNLTGSIPGALLEKSSDGLLTLSVGQNLCASPSCNRQTNDTSKKKKNNVVLPIIALVAGTFVLLVIATTTIMYGLKKRKPQDALNIHVERNTQNGSQLESKKRQYSFNDIVKITNNFGRILGKGGFGTVYHGFIDDTEVAVKMLSSSSAQGYQQFLVEVKLLMRVHHKNLTSLIGYCNEETKIGLIYECMSNGNLDEHLLGKNSRAKFFNWKERLHIALDAAQGLEYLHTGCKPPIIHRDVKCANILLNENFQAKLGDLGLSKSFSTEGGTHFTTVVAGTLGYLDPEYQILNRLTVKSDVYSFGVVLLKIITGQPAIIKVDDISHISNWVSSMVVEGDIKKIVDSRLQENFDTSSAWRAIEIAMACVSNNSTKRPCMSDVVTELKECLARELATKHNRCDL